MKDKLFSKRHFLQALKKAGLPFSYPSLIKMEKEGLIDKPKNMQMITNQEWRFYTAEEIKENIRKLIEGYSKQSR